MKSNTHIHKANFRFRRWSRAGYAVFASLSCCVTIGRLAVSITGKSLLKAAGITAQSITVIASDALPGQAEENFELETAMLQLQQQASINEITTVSAAACAPAFTVLYSIT